MPCCKQCGDPITEDNKVEYIAPNGKLCVRGFCNKCEKDKQRNRYLHRNEPKKPVEVKERKQTYPCSQMKYPAVCLEYKYHNNSCSDCVYFLL